MQPTLTNHVNIGPTLHWSQLSKKCVVTVVTVVSSGPSALQVFLPGHPISSNCSHYRWCNLQLQAFGETPLSFNYCLRFICILVSQWRNVHIPLLALCCCITPKDDQIITLCTPWTTPAVTTVKNSYAQNCACRLMVPNSEGKILNISKLPKGRTR